MPNTDAQMSVKRFLDQDGLTYFARKLNEYPTNDVIVAVINGVQDALEEKLDKSKVGAKSGVASLGMDGKVPASQLPASMGVTYTITQDSADGHKFIFAGTDGSSTTIIIPDNDTVPTLTSLGIGNVKNYDQSKAIKSISRSGTTFTYTCLDNTTGTFTQQDNNTWTAMVGATSSANGTAGYVPAPPKDGYNTKYLRADGTWQVPPDNNTDTKVTAVGNHYAPAADSNAELSASASGATAAWSIDVVKGVKLQRDAKGHVTGVTVESGKIPANPNTDTKVTSAANHYTPARDTSADKSASATGATAAWGIDVVKGVTVQTDGKGHVTGVVVESGKIPANPDTNTVPSAYCNTAAATAAKAATCTGYTLTANTWLQVLIVNANSSKTAITLNVNGKGAKPIYINGAASSTSNYTLPAGTYFVFYNGTNYYFRTDGKLTANITGDAATVNGKTVGVSVPADAKFTDTTYEAITDAQIDALFA